MKNRPAITFAITCALLAFLGGSCSSIQDQENLDLRFIASKEKLTELIGFIQKGETTEAQVVEELGTPFLSREFEDGTMNLLYLWSTNRFSIPVKKDPWPRETFDPGQGGKERRVRNIDRFDLSIWFEPNGFVDEVHYPE